MVFRVGLALGLIAGAAGSAAAEEVLKRPDSCVLVATAQYDDCTVENIYTCGSGDETIWNSETYGAGGLEAVWTYDPVGRTGNLEDFTGVGDARFRFSGATFADVDANGWAQGSYEADFEEQGEWFTVLGDETFVDEGKTVVVAGKTFREVIKTQVMHMPGTTWRVRMRDVVLYDEALDLSILQETRTEDVVPADPGRRLMSLALTDQPGLGSETPTHGCLETSGLATGPVGVPA